MQLADDVVRLRPFVDADVPAVARACADPVSRHFLPALPEPYTEDDARTYVALTREWEEDGRSVARAVVDSESDELLGSIDVRLGEVGSVGYWVAPWARGRGVATRALALAARWALAEGGVERLELTTAPDNTASQRVAEKVGFVREGVLRAWMTTPTGRRDSVMFSLLPSDLD